MHQRSKRQFSKHVQNVPTLSVILQQYKPTSRYTGACVRVHNSWRKQHRHKFYACRCCGAETAVSGVLQTHAKKEHTSRGCRRHGAPLLLPTRGYNPGPEHLDIVLYVLDHWTNIYILHYTTLHYTTPPGKARLGSLARSNSDLVPIYCQILD